MLYLDRPGAPLRLPVTPDQWWYFVTLGILALLLWMTHNLIAGRIGRGGVGVAMASLPIREPEVIDFFAH